MSLVVAAYLVELGTNLLVAAYIGVVLGTNLIAAAYISAYCSLIRYEPT